MSKKYRWLGLFALCLILFGSVFLVNNEVYATEAIHDLYQRAYANNLSLCYVPSVLKENVDIFPEKSGRNVDEGQDFNHNDILVPSGKGKAAGIYLGHTKVSSSLQQDCGGLLGKGISNVYLHRIFDEFGKQPPTIMRDADAWMRNMGYTPVEEKKTNVRCYSVTAKHYDKIGEQDSRNNYVCWKEEGYPGNGIYDSKLDSLGVEGKIVAKSVTDDNANNGTYGNFVLTIGYEINDPIYHTSSTEEQCRVVLPDNFADIKEGDKLECKFASGYYSLVGFEKTESVSATIQREYEIRDKDYNKAYETARKYFTGKEGWLDQHPFTETDIVKIYMNYLNDPEVKSSSLETGVCQDERPDQIYDKENEKYYIFNGKQYCTISVNKGALEYHYGGFERPADESRKATYLYPNKILSFENLIEDLVFWAERNSDAAEENSNDIGEITNPGNNSQNGGDDLCYSSAGAMGWILCPAIVATTGVGNFMWDQMKGYLQFDVSILNQGQSVEQGWNTMRDIANVIFIILFLFVIFSQLTGVGIDNYGIKKILPKLVVIAILINLSFVLCRIFVDLSNILGVGLQKMFEGLAENIQTTDTNPDATAGMFVGGATGLVVAGVGIAFLFNFLKGQGWGQFFASAAIAIGGALIVVLVGIFVGFLILSIRQAGVVIAIVLSPIAVVLYALPNTEKLSKKWWEIFKALLIVYPICGAMMGAGVFAKKLFVDKAPLIAMIISVVPFFFVPILLKNSLSAMGNLGGKISALGRGLGRKGSSAATGLVKNSERYKDFQQYHSNLAARRRAQRVSDRLAGRTDLSARQQNRVRKAHEVLAAGSAQDAADRNRSQQSYLEAAQVAAKKKFKDEEVENYMSLVNNETRNGDDETKLYELFDKAVNSGNESMAVAIARIAGRRADTARRFANKKFSNNSAMEGHQDLFRTVAKEIATGANSGNYRQSSPFDFEYASQVNKDGYGKTGGYSTWSRTKNSDGMTGMSAALDHHVGKTSELMAMKKDALKDIRAAMDSDALTTTEKERLRDLAQATIRARDEGRDNGTFDYNKSEEIEKIANWTPRDGVDIVHNSQ